MRFALSRLADREDHSPEAFYLFNEGAGPLLSTLVKENLTQECTHETATKTSFAEFNDNRVEWNGLCVLMKPEPASDKGNF